MAKIMITMSAMTADDTTAASTIPASNADSNTTTITAEEAAQRAREIAARLSGQSLLTSSTATTTPTVPPITTEPKLLSAPPDTTNVNTKDNNILSTTNSEDNADEQGGPTSNGIKKRKRWGVMPPGDGDTSTNSAAALGANDALDAAAQARAKALATLAKVIATPAPAASSLLLVGNTVVQKPPPKVPPATKRVWVDAASHSMLSEERPAAHFVAYTNRYIPELINKLNSTIPKPEPTTAVSTNGDGKKDDDDDDGLTIEFKGKGASDKPPVLGMPEEPLHVFIRGPKLLVEQAEYEIDELLEQAKTAPIEEDAINARLAAEGALTTTSSAAAQPIPTTTHYRPASVAQLIGQANMPYEQRMQQDNTPLLEETIGVPNGIVGYIIGRGGENIASMQAKTGAKVQIQKEHELQPGQTERQITLQAHSLEAIKACRTIIENMVQERIRALTGGSNNNHPAKAGLGYNNANNRNDQQQQDSVQAEIALGHKLVEVDVPDADVGLVIGKGGATIKSIQEQTGSAIQVPKSGNVDNPLIRTLRITCPDLQGAQRAKEMVEDVLKTKPGYQQQMRLLQQQGAQMAQSQQQQRPEFSIQVNIPDKDVGLCIGKQGIVIKYMQNTTQTKIQIPPTVATPGDFHRTATIIGPSLDACNQVKQMIDRIVAEQSSQWIVAAAQSLQYQQGSTAGYDANGYGYHQQQYQQQAYGDNSQQQGYSAEWAAYHAAVAAQQQQQQQPAVAAQPAWTQQQAQPQYAAADPTQAAAAQQQQPASADAYYEQFFRYAYYYGEDAARQYYGAWAPPVGTPNPYGVNPNISPAPVTQAATATIPEQAGVSAVVQPDPTADNRETSRRQVSNLPAWMTKK